MSATPETEFSGKGTSAPHMDDRTGESPDRSIFQILQEIVGCVTEIVESEIRLATAEIKRDFTKRTKAAAYLIVAGALMFYAGGLVLLGIVYALSMVWPTWLAALAPAVALIIIAAVLFLAGGDRVKQPPNLKLTAQTVEDNLRWLKNRTN